MKKTASTITLLLLVGLAAGVWVSVVFSQIRGSSAYRRHLELGAQFESKEIYFDALTHYKAALESNPKDYELAMKVAEMYEALDNSDGFVTYCEAAQRARPKSVEPYIALAEHYIREERYGAALKVTAQAAEKFRKDPAVQALQARLDRQTTLKLAAYEEVGDWRHGQKSLAVFKYNNRYGLTKKDGTRVLLQSCEAMGAYDSDSGVLPIKKDGQWYYIDLEGNKRLVGDRSYDELGAFGSGLAPALWEGKYGYIDRQFKEQRHEFDHAGAFSGGVAAVEKNGKWALVDTQLREITGYEYDEILEDSNGLCAPYKLVTARRGNQWLLMDTEGKQLGDRSFDGAAMACSGVGPVAVKVGEKWGFVSRETGELILEGSYEEAKSFAHGLAPVKQGDKWGYIDTKGEWVIEPVYSDAGVFCADGAAPVRSDTFWNFIILCKYDDDNK